MDPSLPEQRIPLQPSSTIGESHVPVADGCSDRVARAGAALGVRRVSPPPRCERLPLLLMSLSVFGVLVVAPATGVPGGAPVPVAGDATKTLQYRDRMQHVPGREGGVAAGEVSL
ncbi:hypothetical protein K1Y78_25220 [Streptomyces sp. tea 10]|nr:hypothetical protein [Streptomyces sp. tea 10]